MGAVFFYHVTRRSVCETVAMLLEKALGVGWRVAIRSPSRDNLSQLDDDLWTLSDDSFLPHGTAGGADDIEQPILLTTGKIANGAQCLICLDGAEAVADDSVNLSRVCIVFDGHDQTAVEQARSQWAHLGNHGLSLQYWSEETGRWQLKAEKPQAS